MPRASEELRAKWGHGDDRIAIALLESRGYVLTPEWLWQIPDGHTPTIDERSAAQYLIDEWDYGGFEGHW